MPLKTVTKIVFPLKAAPEATATVELRVAAYARVSSVKDAQENSLESQKEYFERYINGHPGWAFAGVYVDDGISGLSYHRREGFNRMVQDALDGKIDRIITKSLSRFARNTVDALTTIRKLKAVGVAVYFQKENIDTLDTKGEFLLTLMSSFAEEESRSISENVTWAVRHRFSQGIYWMPYKVFLGYRRSNDGKITIDEAEARTVRYIYWLALQGIQPQHIARILDSRGISPPGRATSWLGSTVYSILRNEKYKGDARLQKKVTTDFLTKSTKKNEGEAPQYYVENGHPAIVSKAVWAEAQERLAAIPGDSQTSDPFFGKIRCGNCGGLYGRRIWHSTTTRDVVWECYNRKTGKTRCRCSHVYDSELQHAVFVVLQRLLSRYPDITQECFQYSTDTLHTGSDALHICKDRRSSILPGSPVFDDAAVRFLIKEIKITSGGTAMFHLLDGSRLRYPLSAATPNGRPGMAEKRRNHQRIMELHSSGMGATEIARALSINVNTVRSYLRRQPAPEK